MYNRYEYVVSDGPGTMLAHGFITLADVFDGALIWAQDYTLMIEPVKENK